MGTSKVYILDKYFNELQKFWDTEKRLQGNSHGNNSVKLRNTDIANFREKYHLVNLNGLTPQQ